MTEPTREQRDHALKLAEEFQFLMLRKYKKGQKEHGGNLWDKETLLDNAIDEVVDLAIYLLTLREQLNRKFFDPGDVNDESINNICF
jgi:hypothetical protein